MIKDLNKYIDFLCKKRITANQFLMCYLIYKKDVKNIIKYVAEVGAFNKEDIEDLIERDFILTTFKGQYELDNFIVTPKFTDIILTDNDSAAEELWNAYPKWINIESQGKEVSARSCGLTKVEMLYSVAIKGDIILHKSILLAVRNYKRRNKYAEMGIDKFIESKHWELLLEKYKDSNVNTGYGSEEI